MPGASAGSRASVTLRGAGSRAVSWSRLPSVSESGAGSQAVNRAEGDALQQRPPVGMIGGARLRVLLEVADDSACFSKSRMKGGGPVPPTAATQRRVWSRPERAAPRAQPPPRGRAEQERSPREASTVTPEEPSAPHPSDEIVPCVTAGPRLAACCYWLMGARWRWATGERWANGAAQAAGLRRFRPAMHRRCCARTPGAPRGGACSPRARSGCELRAIQWLRVLGAVLAPSRPLSRAKRFGRSWAKSGGRAPRLL